MTSFWLKQCELQNKIQHFHATCPHGHVLAFAFAIHDKMFCDFSKVTELFQCKSPSATSAPREHCQLLWIIDCGHKNTIKQESHPPDFNRCFVTPPSLLCCKIRVSDNIIELTIQNLVSSILRIELDNGYNVIVFHLRRSKFLGTNLQCNIRKTF